MRDAPVLRLGDVRKSFGPVEVLKGVDLEVRAGEIHVLAGENGAGKSTLIRILSGVYQDWTGTLELEGEPRRFRSPVDAVRAGISTIHQELALVPDLSVADNFFLGRERRTRWGTVDLRAQREEARTVLREGKMEARPDDEVGRLPLSVQQAIEIARALAGDLRLLILDEPTSALDEREVARLFDRLAALRARGRAIIYITHKMEEIYRLADRITVLRDGRSVGTATAHDLPRKQLVAWMVGRAIEDPAPGAAARPGGVALEVSDLSVAHPRVPGRRVVDGVSLEVRRGEILGLAGLQGCGGSELLHALFGARPWAAGTLRLDGADFDPASPADAIGRGVMLLANDRKALGLAPDLSVVHNAGLAALPRHSRRLGWLDRRGERRAVEDVGRTFALRAPSLDAPVRTLSGGNQQKVYLARCLLTRPRVLLLDEPTRGIDVAAKADVYRLLRAWAGEGIAILLITSELDELLALAHRILVLHRGRIVARLSGREATKDRVIAAAMGTEGGQGAA